MQRKFYSLILLAATAIVVSCNPDKDWVEATIIDTQDITYEGCGYVLELPNSELLKPIHLDSRYQHDGISVKVKYKHTGIQDTCRYGSVIYDMINIQNIKLNK
jgi:hypothetical protein